MGDQYCLLRINYGEPSECASYTPNAFFVLLLLMSREVLWLVILIRLQLFTAAAATGKDKGEVSVHQVLH